MPKKESEALEDSIADQKKRLDVRMQDYQDSEPQAKTRVSVRANFSYSLQLGVLECKDELVEIAKTFGVDGLDAADLSDIAVKCTNFAMKIESNLYVLNEETISPEYGRRFRELIQGLRHKEIRKKLLFGQLKPDEFVKLERD